MRVCIDAGHYGKYNQSPVIKSYYESEMTWKLHLYLKAELESYGIEVITTRESQGKDLSLSARGRMSQDCDFFISLHSNATSSESPDYTVACCQIDDSRTNIDNISQTLGKKLAAVVNTLMSSKGNYQIYKRVGNYNKDYYGVLRSAKEVGTPAVLLEHGFHTNRANTEFLLNDNNLRTLANAEAQIIAEYFGINKPVSETTIYRIRKTWGDAKSQIGAFANLDNAKKACKEGYSVFDENGNVVYTITNTTEKVETPVVNPTPAKPTIEKVNVTYRVYSNGKWWSEITNFNNDNSMGYSGAKNYAVRGLAIKVDKGSIKYRVHKKGGGWLNWITACNINDWNKGIAGSKNIEVDGIQVDFNGLEGYEAKYRVSNVGNDKYLPWVIGTSDYAGIFGKAIDQIQIEIVKT